MSKYKRISIAILLMEIIGIAICNLLCSTYFNQKTTRLYRVEAGRVAMELEEKTPEEIDISAYKTIVGIRPFIAEEKGRYDYVVEEVQGQLYRIEYSAVDEGRILAYVNAGLGFLFLITLLLLLYVWHNMIKPFHNMSELTYELAKGNLAAPIKEQKGKFFGKFLWGLDMLRENLEDSRKKELALHKEKKTLILSLSHDIKTPLSAIDLYVKALSENLYHTEEKRAEVLCGIEKNVKEIKDYVNEIAKASREDFLNLEVKPGDFYLAQAIERVEAYYRDRLSVLHTEFLVEPVENCLLSGDPDRVEEVLQNIMENAIKYGDGKKIRISTEEEEDCRLITVENTGCGLKKEELPNIFDSFYRGSNSQGKNGSGLGLYIAKTLMKKMNGDIFARINPPEFSVTIVIRKA